MRVGDGLAIHPGEDIESVLDGIFHGNLSSVDNVDSEQECCRHRSLISCVPDVAGVGQTASLAAFHDAVVGGGEDGESPGGENFEDRVEEKPKALLNQIFYLETKAGKHAGLAMRHRRNPRECLTCSSSFDANCLVGQTN